MNSKTISTEVQNKVLDILEGTIVIMSDGQLDELTGTSLANFVCSRLNPNRVGVKDTYEVWIRDDNRDKARKEWLRK